MFLYPATYLFATHLDVLKGMLPVMVSEMGATDEGVELLLALRGPWRSSEQGRKKSQPRGGKFSAFELPTPDEAGEIDGSVMKSPDESD